MRAPSLKQIPWRYVILYGDVPYSPAQPTAAAVKKAIVNAFPPPTWMRNEKLAMHYQQPSSGAETFCRYLPLGLSTF